jgi:hypothetical protein
MAAMIMINATTIISSSKVKPLRCLMAAPPVPE